MNRDTEKRIMSNSSVQTGAEKILIQWLSEQLGVPLCESPFRMDGCRMRVDGYYCDNDHIIIVEAWAHIGKAKAAQKNKVMTDVLKLAYISDCLAKESNSISVECYYVFADAAAAEVLTNLTSWNARAGQRFEIQARIADISDELRQNILQAQKQQDIREL